MYLTLNKNILATKERAVYLKVPCRAQSFLFRYKLKKRGMGVVLRLFCQVRLDFYSLGTAGYTQKFIYFFVLIWFIQVCLVEGHGRLMQPPSRASQWRMGFDNPKDYNDNQGFCGGKDVSIYRGSAAVKLSSNFQLST